MYTLGMGPLGLLSSLFTLGCLRGLLRLEVHTGLLALRGGDGAGGVGQRVYAAAGLREGDDIADGLESTQQGDDAIPAESDAAVRRSTELEGIEQEAELLLGFLDRKSVV